MSAMREISVDVLKRADNVVIPELLYKHTIAPGAGECVPPNSEVEIKFKLILRGQTILESDEAKPYIQQCERILPSGLSIAISTMRKSEKALIWMDSALAFGGTTLSLSSELKIPKGSNLVFEVELLSFIEDAESNSRFRRTKSTSTVSHIESDVEKADVLSRQGDKLQALKKLRSSLNSARSLRINAETSPDEERARSKLIRVITVKAAKCAYDAGKYPQAVTLSKEALETDVFDAYMNYVCGCAYFSLGHIKSALRYVRSAHFADIGNEVYEKKLMAIEAHNEMLLRDVEGDSDREEFEEFATYCFENIKQKENKLRKGISKFISKQMEEWPRQAIIGGGFRQKFLDEIADDLIQQRFRVISVDDDSFQVLY